MTEGASEIKNIGLTLIVIFVLVIALLTLFPDLREKALDSFDETSQFIKESFDISSEVLSDSLAANTMSIAMNNLADNASNCADTMCDLSRSTIYNDYLIHVYNRDSDLGLLIQHPDDTLQEETAKANQQLGLLAVKKEGEEYHLGCIFPEHYEIKSYVSTDPESWYVYYEGEEYPFYIIADYYYVGQTFSQKFLEIYKLDDGRKCLLTEFIEEEYTEDLEFTKATDLDISVQNGGDETTFSTDLIFRLLAFGGEYNSEEWQVNNEESFPIEYTCCTDVLKLNWIGQIGSCGATLDYRFCSDESHIFFDNSLYYDTLLECEKDSNTPRNLLTTELTGIAGKRTLTCYYKVD